jgi:hypothetical protein
LTVAVVPFGTPILTVTATGELVEALHFGLLPGSSASCVLFRMYDTDVVAPTVVVSLPPTVTLFVTVSAKAAPGSNVTVNAVAAVKATSAPALPRRMRFSPRLRIGR